MSNLNSMYFSDEDIEKDLHLDLLKHLINLNKSHSLVNDIHIKPEDCNSIIIEWTQKDLSNDEYEGFKYVDYEHDLLLRMNLPDNSFIYVEDDEKENILKDWLENHPEYEYNKTLQRYVEKIENID